MSGPIYVISGANRSIGLALVKEMVEREKDAVIYAGARNPETATELNALAATHPGRIFVVKLISGDVEGSKAVASQIKEKFGHVDAVIANAGISTFMAPSVETPPEVALEHFNVNYIGPLVLFQAMFDLLKASSNPRFIPISSGIASITEYIAMPAGYLAYGTSKIAVNYLARKIHFENEWLTSFPLSPGTVSTDLAKSNREMDKTGSLAPLQDNMAMSPVEAAKLLADVIINATRDKNGGEFMNLDGSKFPW